MIKTPISLQDLRRRIYAKAKAEPSWRFWGLYTHVCKMEVLCAAYEMAKHNNGAPGIDGVTFEDIEQGGVQAFLEEIRGELISHRYQPMRNRRAEIPKDGGKSRALSIPSVRDRVVQGALKLILEPIFEADFQPGSYGYRPKRTAHDAFERTHKAILSGKTRVIDVDLRAFFDTVQHDLLLSEVARRINDDDIMRLLKKILKVSGRKGVPQGGVISPLLSNVYLNQVDRMLERAKEVTNDDGYTHIDYARYADDLVILVDGHRRHEWLVKAADKRIRQEFSKLRVEINEEKSRIVDLVKGESFGFLGFEIRRLRSKKGWWRPQSVPKLKKRTALIRKLKDIFRRFCSQPIERVIRIINPILRGWVNYFRIGNAGRCFGYVRHWVEAKTRRHMMRAQKRRGRGWKRWSTQWIYEVLGLFRDYRVRYRGSRPKALPA